MGRPPKQQQAESPSWPPPGLKERAFLKAALSPGGSGTTQELDGAAKAWLALEAKRAARGLLVVVTESPLTLEALHNNIHALDPTAAQDGILLPAAHAESGKLKGARTTGSDVDALGDRLKALEQCREWKPGRRGLLLTCVQALREAAPDPDQLTPLKAICGKKLDLEQVMTFLASAGYAFGPEVIAKGQASRRGGLLDIWPLTEEAPCRIEFFGDVVESIRTFDPVTQRSLHILAEQDIPPAFAVLSATAEPTDYLPDDAAFLWLSPEAILHYFAMSGEAAAEGEDFARSATGSFKNWRLELRRLFTGGHLDAGHLADAPEEPAAAPLRIAPVEGLAELSGRTIPPDALETERRKFLATLEAKTNAGWHIALFLPGEEAWTRLEAVYGALPWLHRRIGPLDTGFALPAAKWMAVSESDFYGTSRTRTFRRRSSSRRAAAHATERLTDWMDLRPGELVVHVDHGIGKYLGLYEIQFDGARQEVLVIEYADGARLYVPTTQFHLLSRYVGSAHAAPPLHKLGGKRWKKEKRAAEQAATDLAAQMLETQARRAALPGHAFAADTPWQAEFERAFPYTETPDQARAIEEVKADMENERPMDRLICGDAGYGKTEVAMRAAFKAVMDGRQVVLLAPTTVLAQQHYETFLARMSRFPVAVEVLSRFRTPHEQRDTLQRAAAGRTDILIGTHRLLQKDVHLPNLGLVIIDEEQRFGVAAKEHLKQIRERVDVLTLSATPIPRTLYLGLMGARDMSIIQTAPRERLPIETYVASDSDDLIRDAIRREIARGGQVFFLHNRVQTIGIVERRLKKLLPRLRIATGHGQMSEKALANTMHRFIRHECDLLLCTTIIGSGVDIPNVNTLLIDRADRFGMADLYQIRGRVGRGGRQAYAYLLLPRHGGLFGAARERIQAIRRHTSLGAGFKLALRDLEIRGAGSVLGAAQSGHIAAVGFDLYCQLLARTVARLKGEGERPIIEVDIRFDFLTMDPAPADPTRAAAFPRDYIEEENQRIAIYRRIASLAYLEETDALAEELRDRFGPMPPSVQRLLAIARIRITAAALGLRTLETKGNLLYLRRPNDHYLMPGNRHPRLHKHGADARLEEIQKHLTRLLHTLTAQP